MGRILLVLGIIMLIGGIIISVAGSFLGLGNMFSGGLGDTIEAATNGEETAAQFCEEGEELVTERGAQSYTPGTGYGTNVTYYCEDSAGNRRDVTGDFVETLVGDLPQDILGSIMPMFGSAALGMVATMLGVVLLIVGGIMMGRKRMASMQSFTVSPGGSGVMFGGSGSPIQGMPVNRPTAGAPTGGGNLAEKLKQLEALRDQGLINAEEFAKMRQQLLDKMS
jgi:hypothetical protein